LNFDIRLATCHLSDELNFEIGLATCHLSDALNFDIKTCYMSPF
jgi:hypothetical protein